MPQTNQTFIKLHANGKLLLSGEYLVLYGAKALAIPLKRGQTLEVNQHQGEDFIWKATHPQGHWFEAQFNDQLKILNASDSEKAKKLQEILTEAGKLTKKSINFAGLEAHTHLEFDPFWGWGSSSTLVSNVARWLNIDPYKLLKKTFGGSGYDIACATAHSPVFYSLKNKQALVEPVAFNPPFADKLWVVYLNRKQSSAEAIKTHISKNKVTDLLLNRISKISEQMTKEISERVFMELMAEHESLAGEFIGQQPVRKRLFNDFPGQIKSLGAWGGDFILALSQTSDSETKKYFQTKGLNILFSLGDIKLNTSHAT
jgi:mevalonate kinase